MNGEAAMYFLGDWIFENIPPDQADNYDFFRFPVLNKSVESVEIVHTYGMFGLADNDQLVNTEKLLSFTAGKTSQTKWVELTKRIAANKNVDPSLYSEAQQKLYKGIEATSTIISLFENNTDPDFTAIALEIIKSYWENPDSIDSMLNELEQARKEVFEK